jgi:hypothetical protein
LNVIVFWQLSLYFLSYYTLLPFFSPHPLSQRLLNWISGRNAGRGKKDER